MEEPAQTGSSAAPSSPPTHRSGEVSTPESPPVDQGSPDCPDGPELLLEPAGHPAVKPYREALAEDGIPLAQFTVDDVEAEYDRLTKRGVSFTQTPTDIGTAVVAVLDDTCGNLIQLITEKPATA